MGCKKAMKTPSKFTQLYLIRHGETEQRAIERWENEGGEIPNEPPITNKKSETDLL
jgi:hypothetical protein